MRTPMSQRMFQSDISRCSIAGGADAGQTAEAATAVLRLPLASKNYANPDAIVPCLI